VVACMVRDSSPRDCTTLKVVALSRPAGGGRWEGGRGEVETRQTGAAEVACRAGGCELLLLRDWVHESMPWHGINYM
jgi:hypothetical protein